MISSFPEDQAKNQSERNDVLIIEEEILELENSIRHLIRSNIEMSRYISEEHDDELILACKENKDTISKKQKLIKSLRVLIDEICPMKRHGSENSTNDLSPKKGDGMQMDIKEGVLL